jgi:hypothetical protein
MSTWTPATRPTGHRTVTPSVYRNIYYLGEEIILQLSPGDAQTFEIRNYYGTVVATGLIDGTNNRIVVPPLPLGWYKVYFLRGTPTAAPWLQSGGEDSFVVVRTGGPMPPRPPFGTPRISPGGDTLVDGKSAPERGFTASPSPTARRMRPGWLAVSSMPSTSRTGSPTTRSARCASSSPSATTTVSSMTR